MPYIQLLDDLKGYVQQFLQADFQQPLAQTAKIDTEILHQLRVSARSLNVMLHAHHDDFHTIKSLITNSNETRDLDVLIFEVLVSIAEEEKLSEAIQKIKDSLLLSRNHAAEDLQDWLMKEDFLQQLQQVQLDLDHDKEVETQSSKPKKSINILSLDDIQQQLQTVETALSDKSISNKDVHKQRLFIKALRYQVAHFYKDKPDLLNHLRWMQEKLGKFHDKDQALKILKNHLTIKQLKTYQKIELVLRKQQRKLLKKLRKRIK